MKRWWTSAAAAAVLLAAAGCSNADDASGTGPAPTPTSSPTEATSSPSESTSPTTPPETPKQKAIRLAIQQTKAYLRASDRVYGDPELRLSILDKYANTQALLEAKSSIQKRRDLGHRWVGHATVTRTWLGPERVVFNKNAPMAVVDLYICYDLNDAHFVDRQGREVQEDIPQVAQERFAVYSDDWPNDSPSDWRVGKEYAAGEPCPQ